MILFSYRIKVIIPDTSRRMQIQKKKVIKWFVEDYLERYSYDDDYEEEKEEKEEEKEEDNNNNNNMMMMMMTQEE